jgi:hypothetical protein
MGARTTWLSSPIRPICGLLLAVALLLGMSSSAQAAGPVFSLHMTGHDPESFIRRSDNNATSALTITNTGDVETSGEFTVTFNPLPAGVKRTGLGGEEMGCTVGATTICRRILQLGPGQTINVSMGFEVFENAPDSFTNSATIAGGGAAAEATVSETIPVIPAPPYALRSFDASSTNEAPTDYTVAGGHPYQTTNRWTFPNYFSRPYLSLWPVAEMKDASVKLPLGYFGNPAAAPRCPIGDITFFSAFFSTCPPGSQIGKIGVALLGSVNYSEGFVPLFNVVPDKGFSAQFVFNIGGTQLSLYVVPLPRTESYGLTIGSANAARVGLQGFSATFFGVPSEHGQGNSGAPFLTNPVNCSEAEPTWRLSVDSWEQPGVTLADGRPNLSDPSWLTATEPTPPVTGCEDPALASQFQPSIEVKPVQEGAATQADQPAGLKTDLRFPQSNDPTDLSTVFNPKLPQSPEPKTITVKLPAGLSISPSSASGLEGCSDSAADPAGDQVHYDNTVPVSCPNASIIGTATAFTPLLASRDPVDDAVTGAEPIHGEVFLIKPHPGDLSPSGDQDGTFRVLIQLEQPRYGINFKLPGIITANKTTGQLTARFTENPQLPTSHLELNFKSGPRAPLATPTTCGSFTTTSDMVPWSSPGTPDANPSSTFAINSGPGGSACAPTPAARPFHPVISAGTESAAAGQSSPFVLHLTRNDGEQEFSSLELTAPKGFTASLKGVPYCSEAAIASATGKSGAAELANPSCPAASQVGSLTVGAGPGPNPFFATGKAYLAGPYKGAPLSIVLITPAVAGPFDLGSVVVRTPLAVNHETTQVTIHSAPIPQILDGVPLRIHSIAVRIDRPGFTRNPTNCEAKEVSALVNGSSGASATPSNKFKTTGCEQLGFAPKLALKLKGGTRRSDNPALTATVTYPKGTYANIASTSVLLPHSEFLDNAHIRNPCTRVVFAEGATPGERCPASSQIGFARAETPLLDKPLEGPVYLRSSSHKLPDIVAALNGQIFVELDGRVDSVHERLRTSFESVPDAPVSKFVLSLDGDKKGLLVNSENLCRGRQVASVKMLGQNGEAHNIKPLISNGCKKPKKRARHGSRHASHHRRR